MKAALTRSWLLWQLLLALALLVLIWPAIALAQSGDAIDPASDLGMWSLLVGAALPALVAVVIQSGWSRPLQVFIGLGSSAIAAFVTTWLTEGDALWDQGMLHAFLLIAVSSWASYNAFWKPSGIAPRIEVATSPNASGPP